ncbi:unnamed protein product [Ascophyllum nodosum]
MMLPRNIGRAIALAADGIAYMVDIITGTKVPLLNTGESFGLPPSGDASGGNPGPSQKSRSSVSSHQPSPGVKAGGESGRGRLPRSLPSVLCMALDRRAGNVCLGTVNGRVVAVRTSDGRVSHSISVVGCSKVTEMDFSRDGKWMLVSSGERVIRMLDRQGTTGKSVRDFQDVVNRTRWQCCRFTGDSEYVAGGSKAEAACSIYIWGIGGHLVTRLEGPQVGLRSLARHPVRPFLAAALDNGKVQLWGNTHTANWTAFAADFEELEENVEYVEKEDEFDVVVDARNPEGQKRKTAAEQQQEEDEEKLTVSIDAIDTVAAWSTASETEENSAPFYLSTEPGAAAREGWYDLEAQASKGRVAPRAEGWSDEDEWTVHRVGPRLRESSLEANESSLEKKECKGPLHDVPVVVKRNKKKRRRPASVGGSIQSSSSREGDVDRSHGVAPGGDSVGGDRERGRGEREVGKASSVKGRLTLSVLGAAPKTKKKRPRDDGRGEK